VLSSQDLLQSDCTIHTKRQMTVVHNGILFSYNYCTILMLIHYHYGEISTKVCTHSTDEVKRKSGKNISNLLFRRIRCSRSKPTN